MGDETKVQMREVAKGVEAVGGIVERYLIRILGPLGRKISQASKTGRYMALAGVVTILVSSILIYMNSLYFSTTVARRGVKTLIIRYQMEGYGIPLLVGIALFVFGIMQRKGR
ncbi:MAG: hypothetical protein A2X56_10925 [Nitrospirae bacterium GWC2_57_13]|jgi:hypothetical protein|nr:MAG: hypothetical protein A2072_00785 [Nitrospirae bacterium GWC1_57_7]OGW30041.1 MAG: hypothetical protein A2X56_10925 [Nitrospirae bacterium GWC2_57_13]OGW41920.1 MAG: hypothetical protein A2X57_09790 [Nitrospirae bacterium GWD2_57_8]HAR45925.1 hypothetical protein [Nitrospiraceae bacterium]HAS55530.1 hypothetical protein [Nitrospiraceae bacterium]